MRSSTLFRLSSALRPLGGIRLALGYPVHKSGLPRWYNRPPDRLVSGEPSRLSRLPTVDSSIGLSPKAEGQADTLESAGSSSSGGITTDSNHRDLSLRKGTGPYLSPGAQVLIHHLRKEIYLRRHKPRDLARWHAQQIVKGAAVRSETSLDPVEAISDDPNIPVEPSARAWGMLMKYAYRNSDKASVRTIWRAAREWLMTSRANRVGGKTYGKQSMPSKVPAYYDPLARDDVQGDLFFLYRNLRFSSHRAGGTNVHQSKATAGAVTIPEESYELQQSFAAHNLHGLPRGWGNRKNAPGLHPKSKEVLLKAVEEVESWARRRGTVREGANSGIQETAEAATETPGQGNIDFPLTGILIAVLRYQSSVGEDKAVIRLIKLYRDAFMQSKDAGLDWVTLGAARSWWRNSRPIMPVTQPRGPPTGASLLTYAMKAMLVKKRSFEDMKEVLAQLTGVSLFRKQRTGKRPSGKDPPPVDLLSAPKDFPLMPPANPMLFVPDETTISHILKSLNQRYSGVNRAFRFVKAAERVWGPLAFISGSHKLKRRTDRQGKKIPFENSPFSPSPLCISYSTVRKLLQLVGKSEKERSMVDKILAESQKWSEKNAMLHRRPSGEGHGQSQRFGARRRFGMVGKRRGRGVSSAKRLWRNRLFTLRKRGYVKNRTMRLILKNRPWANLKAAQRISTNGTPTSVPDVHKELDEDAHKSVAH